MRNAMWFLAVALFCGAAWAQTTQFAQISGTVSDPSGSVVPGTTVTITNDGTGLKRTVVTGDDGRYTLTNLAVGTYSLEVTKQGFRVYKQHGIVLQLNTNPAINVTLAIGSANELVEVAADAPLVETHSVGIGQIIDDRAVVDLPLNGRQVTQLVTLSGGSTNFVPVSAGQSLVSNKNYPTVSAFSIAGGQGGQTLFVLDGAPHMDPISNIGLPMPFPDVLQEFKVETSSLPANYGSQPGGVVNVVMKSGTNQFHGDVFEFLRNYNLNARNYFATTTDGLKRNQFGGAIGGPIVKDKVFFYSGYQGTFESVAPAANIAYVATPATLAGDFTQIASPACNGGKQITLKAPFVGNKVAAGMLNPVALKALGLMPTSSDPCGKLTFAIPSSDHETQIAGRLDWQKSSRNSLFTHYFVADFEHAPYYTNNLLTTSTDASVGLADRVQSIVLGDTLTLSPTVVSTFRLSYSRSAIRRYLPGSVPTPTRLGSQVFQGTPNYTFFSVSNYFTVDCQNCSPGPWVSNDFNIGEDINLMSGRHQISFGGNWMHSNLSAYGNFQVNGDFFFTGQVTGNALADFEVGDLARFMQSTGQRVHEGINMPSLYAQDNFHVNSHFSINVGLRWDPFLLPYNNDKQASIFDISWFQQGVKSKVFPNAPAGTLFYGDPGMPGKSYGYGRIANFAPRLGVVYDPRGKGLESLRAGYGIFYGATPLFMQVGTHAPWASPIVLPQPVGGLSNPFQGYPGGNPFPLPAELPSTTQFPAFGGGLGSFKLHPQPTYMEQWNLSFQKQLPHQWLVSASYIGNRTVHLEIAEINNPVIYIPGNCAAGQYGLKAPGPCSTASNENYRRTLLAANPVDGLLYGAVNLFGDSANANYNGLLLSAQHRFSNNFSLLANETWSHCLTESEVALNGAAGPQNPFNRHAEYANCLSDHRHVFNLSLVAQTPKFSGKWLQRLAGNWQAAPIFTAQTGSYSTVVDGVDNSLTGTTDRPNLVGDPNLNDPSLQKWFNTAAFARAPVGQFGTLGRSTILGPGAWDLDLALSRMFRLTERQSIEARAEAFNIMNHPRFGNPVTAMNSGIFGQINTAGDPRIMQLAVKYKF